MLNHNSNEYYVDSFLDMQKDLANFLGESHDINGEWTIAEKKRFINKGCLAVATMTLTTHRSIAWDIKASATNELRSITVPDVMLKPKRLFIDNYEYLQMDLDEFLTNLGSSIDSEVSNVTNVTQLQTSNRFFYWNEGNNTFDINPPISDNMKAVLYMVGAPKLLVNDGDIPDIHPSWSYLAPIWAAKQMLDKDEEHRDRGEVARRRWRSGLKDFERFKHRGVGNKATKMIKDPGTFSSGSGRASSEVDFGSTWDRLP